MIIDHHGGEDDDHGGDSPLVKMIMVMEMMISVMLVT